MNDKIEIFPIKKHCHHGYKNLKRVHDIDIDGEVFRQVNCAICGKYRYKINLKDYHPALLSEVIKVKQKNHDLLKAILTPDDGWKPNPLAFSEKNNFNVDEAAEIINWNDELAVAFAEIHRFSSGRTTLKQFKEEIIGTDWETALRKTAKEILKEWYASQLKGEEK